MHGISVLITDLDNTLFDWVRIWHASFRALIDEVSAQSGVPEETLLSDIRRIHRAHGTSEYTFVLQEIASLRRLHPGEDLARVYARAIKAYRTARAFNMTLYPGVAESLRLLASRGTVIIGYTESIAFQTNYRMRRLGLDGVLDYLYSSPDHDFPLGMTRADVRGYHESHYMFTKTVHRHTPKGAKKPNAAVLGSILEEVGAQRDRTLYVGDSLMKDVAMANEVGVLSALAAYGAVHESQEYQLLRAVSHWSDDDIEREAELLKDAEGIRPSVVLQDSFAEIFQHFRFVRHGAT